VDERSIYCSGSVRNARDPGVLCIVHGRNMDFTLGVRVYWTKKCCMEGAESAQEEYGALGSRKECTGDVWSTLGVKEYTGRVERDQEE
jgi:hypothetical protein